MKSSTTYKTNSQFALLLQGAPKSGKTSLVMANFPGVYIIDCDQNINGAFKVLNDLKKAGKVETKKEVFYDNITTDEKGNVIEPPDQWMRLVELTKAGLLNPMVQTLCHDSLTTVVQALLAHILKMSPGKNKLAGEPMMEIQHWQPFQTLLTRLIMMCRTSGKKYVMCAHEEVVKDEVSGILQHKINVPSQKMQGSIGGLFTDCWHIEQIENPKGYESSIRTMSTVRLPGLGNTMGLPVTFNPVNTDIINKGLM